MLPAALTVGVGLTVNDAEVAAVQPFTDVTVKLYTPLLLGAAGLTDVVCEKELKPRGPFQM